MKKIVALFIITVICFITSVSLSAMPPPGLYFNGVGYTYHHTRYNLPDDELERDYTVVGEIKKIFPIDATGVLNEDGYTNMQLKVGDKIYRRNSDGQIYIRTLITYDDHRKSEYVMINVRPPLVSPNDISLGAGVEEPLPQ